MERAHCKNRYIQWGSAQSCPPMKSRWQTSTFPFTKKWHNLPLFHHHHREIRRRGLPPMVVTAPQWRISDMTTMSPLHHTISLASGLRQQLPLRHSSHPIQWLSSLEVHNLECLDKLGKTYSFSILDITSDNQEILCAHPKLETLTVNE